MTDRSQRVETDVNVYRLHLTALPEGVVFGWDYPGSTLLCVRIVRALAAGITDLGAIVADDFGKAWAAAVTDPDPEPSPDDPWRVVYDGDTGSFRDRDVAAGGAWRYAVFARDGDGPWVLWRDEVVTLP